MGRGKASAIEGQKTVNEINKNEKKRQRTKD